MGDTEGRAKTHGDERMTTTTPTIDVIEFSIPGRAPATMSPNARKSWHQKHADGSEYGVAVKFIAQVETPVRTGLPWARAHVTLTQKAVRLRDHDNFAASFKPGLDAIVRAGIIIDDKPSVIDLSLRAEKVRHERDECVHVRIERINEHEHCAQDWHRCDGGGKGEYDRYVVEPGRDESHGMEMQD